jgi:mercuric ion transport protein
MMLKSAPSRTTTRSAWLSYFSLFTSLSTLFCCALPSLLVLVGLGATVASALSALPWLVTLSRYKVWSFSISGVLIGASFINMYWLMPRLNRACSADDPGRCAEASWISEVLLWTSAVIYAAGLFVAYALGPILSRIDGS